MSTELKYKEGQEVFLKGIITKIDNDSVPYRILTSGHELWVNESQLYDTIESHTPQLQNIQDQTIERAQMVASIYGAIMKNHESEGIKHILEFLGKKNETYKYPEHWIEYISKISVLHADAIISELKQKRDNG